jgi:translation initiation factor 2 subunit 1
MDKKLPRRGEFVVATVKEIVNYGAYLHLDDYGIDGFLPISEASSRWIRKLEDVIKVGQKVVAKVTRLDRYTNSVDLSLKEVAAGERDRILRNWKRNRRGKRLLEELSKHMDMSYTEILNKFGDIIKEAVTIYDAIIDVVTNPELIDDTYFTEDEKKVVLEFLGKRIHPKKYIYEVIINASYIGRDGVSHIKKAFEKIERNIEKVGDVEIKIMHIAAPRYNLRLESHKSDAIKKAKQLMAKVLEKASKDLDIKVLEEKSRVEI